MERFPSISGQPTPKFETLQRLGEGEQAKGKVGEGGVECVVVVGYHIPREESQKSEYCFFLSCAQRKNRDGQAGAGTLCWCPVQILEESNNRTKPTSCSPHP